MHLWTLKVPAADVELWEARLALAEVAASFLSAPEDPLVTIEVYTGREEQARALADCWGGEVGTPLPESEWFRQGMSRSEGRALEIGERFLVSLDDRDAFLAELRRRHPGRDQLLVYPPGLAFGTGDHETTATCIELLEQVAGRMGPDRSWTVLDLGCGTGILGTAAARLGAAQVIGLDNDPRAIEVAERCWALNGSPGGDAVSWALADVFEWEPEVRHNVVLANLFSGILIAVIPKIRNAVVEDGTVILSGILENQAEAVVAAARVNGFAVPKQLTVGKWSTLQLEPVRA